MLLKKLGAFVIAAAAAGLILIAQPDIERKLSWAEDELSGHITSREYHIDPAELLELMWNNQLRLALIDVRGEADFNLFHLIDARQFTFSNEDLLWSKNLPEETVRVVMSNDEHLANESWKKLRVLGVPNVYILSGGINEWLSLCKPHQSPPERLKPTHILKTNAHTLDKGELKYTFPAALGDRYPEARPPANCFSGRDYDSKVKVLKPVFVPTGGCGG